MLSVLAGARRFAQTSLLRADVALHALLGISRFPVDDTIRNFFKRFDQGQCQRFFSGLWNWQLERLPECGLGYSLDLDSTVFERYGHQQGALRGPNPRKHGRPSHHPLVAVLAEAHFLLHGTWRSGISQGGPGAVTGKTALRVVRADAGSFDQQLLSPGPVPPVTGLLMEGVDQTMPILLVAITTTPFNASRDLGRQSSELPPWHAHCRQHLVGLERSAVACRPPRSPHPS
jgi:hypothetical protein